MKRIANAKAGACGHRFRNDADFGAGLGFLGREQPPGVELYRFLIERGERSRIVGELDIDFVVHRPVKVGDLHINVVRVGKDLFRVRDFHDRRHVRNARRLRRGRVERIRQRVERFCGLIEVLICADDHIGLVLLEGVQRRKACGWV